MSVPTLTPEGHHCVRIVSWTLRQPSQFSTCLFGHISSCHSTAGWQKSREFGRLCQNPSQGILQHPQTHLTSSHEPLHVQWAEQSVHFCSSAVGTASPRQEKVEGCTAFRAERKLMNPPKCSADFPKEYVSILLEQSYFKMCFYVWTIVQEN